ncbi:MAG TPA: outer membrane beta-barrel protein [Bdellovibrionales bacterium]|nr:outer membrane beta-barrel protein [Bdellovibrionales bacterium]
MFLLLLGTSTARAGFIEVGASVNYRSSGYDENNYIKSLTYTGSMSYYFMEMCAFEINYTTGYSKQLSKGNGATDPKTLIEDSISLVSGDLVLSFAGRQDPFRPYIKVGAGYLTKERFRKVNDDARERISEQSGMVPSAGLGVSVSLTKEFSIKFGVDAWTSPMDEDPLVVDYAGRAGISWIF